MNTTPDSDSVPVSKVLVLDNDPVHLQTIKQFCDANGLVPLKVRKGAVMSVLRTNIDLGGILYSEDYGDTPEETTRIALEIHSARPELPIIMRRKMVPTLTDLGEVRSVLCATYVASDMTALRKVIDEYIFCLIYPNALLRGIGEITTSVLGTQFADLQVSMETPCIVHDRVIFGELFSLMQLESAWCRGYMMLQTEESPFLELAQRGVANSAPATFRDVNDLLSEITNLIWGAFKNRYIGDAAREATSRQSQVPLLVNHRHKYISFGSENPQLCFRYILTDKTTGRSSDLYERFVFNLDWSPEEFKEIPQELAQLVDSGELELF